MLCGLSCGPDLSICRLVTTSLLLHVTVDLPEQGPSRRKCVFFQTPSNGSGGSTRSSVNEWKANISLNVLRAVHTGGDREGERSPPKQKEILLPQRRCLEEPPISWEINIYSAFWSSLISCQRSEHTHCTGAVEQHRWSCSDTQLRVYGYC